MTAAKPVRSFIIPVLDFSPHGPYNILTLLDDLDGLAGEVVCVFNSRPVFDRLAGHPRIDKYCFNKLNAGVSRSWNMGLNLAEGRTAFFLNADLHLGPAAVTGLEAALAELDRAVIVGPEGSHLDFADLRVLRRFVKGGFDAPVRTHDVSGFFFAVDTARYYAHGLRFDVRFSPVFSRNGTWASRSSRPAWPPTPSP